MDAPEVVYHLQSNIQGRRGHVYVLISIVLYFLNVKSDIKILKRTKFNGKLTVTCSKFFGSTWFPRRFYRSTSSSSTGNTCCSIHCNPKLTLLLYEAISNKSFSSVYSKFLAHLSSTASSLLSSNGFFCQLSRYLCWFWIHSIGSFLKNLVRYGYGKVFLAFGFLPTTFLSLPIRRPPTTPVCFRISSSQV